MRVLAVLTVVAVLQSTLPSFCLSYKNKTVVAVLAVMAVSVVTATLPKLNPSFPTSRIM